MPCPKNCTSCTSCCKNRVIKGNLTVCGDITFGNCLKTQGEIREVLTVEAPCLTVGCNVTLNAFEFGVQSREFNQVGTPAEFPINLVIPQTIPEDDSIVVNGLKITNIRGDGVYPDGTGGPWYVESGANVNAPDATQVVTCGLRENYVSSFVFGDQVSPNEFTISQATITLDPSAPPNSKATFDLHLGYSTEASYDFLNVYKNDVTLFSQSGNGPISAPYLTAVLPQLTLVSGDTIKIEFTKDGGAYSGVDSTYFYLKNQIFIPVPLFATTIKLIRDSVEVLKLSDFPENPDNVPVNSSVQFVKEIELQAGDQICLDYDTNAYSDYTILFTAQKRIGGNIYELDNYKAPLQTNSLVYNLRTPAPSTQIGGWYETDDTFAYAFVEDKGSELLVKTYNFNGNRKNLINEIGIIPVNTNTWTKNDDGSYTNTTSEMSYIFDSGLKQLRSDFSNTTNVEQLGINGNQPIIYRKVGKPDERFSKYSFDIQNDDQIFNDPRTMFDMLHDYYSGGRITAFGSESKPLLDDINPLGLDQTQVQRGFGAVTKSEFEDLYIRLRDDGILRKYNTKRFIYWQDPDGEALSPAIESALRWQVNQQRYELLGFVCDNPEENENPRGYAKLVPGENVVMKGSGTRLDDIPLSLYLDGYHTGPKPSAGFIPDSQYDNWSFYSIQLPLVIDSTNDKLFIKTLPAPEWAGTPLLEISVPHGNYTIGQLNTYLTNKVNELIPVPKYSPGLNFSAGFDVFVPIDDPPRVPQPQPTLRFQLSSKGIVCEITSPTHSNVSLQSTLLGLEGLNLGYLFNSPAYDDNAGINDPDVKREGYVKIEMANNLIANVDSNGYILKTGVSINTISAFGDIIGDLLSPQQFNISGNIIPADPINYRNYPQETYVRVYDVFTNLTDGVYFTIYSAGDATQYYVWFGTTDPLATGTGVHVDTSLVTNDEELAQAIVDAINTTGDFDAYTDSPDNPQDVYFNTFNIAITTSSVNFNVFNLDVQDSFVATGPLLNANVIAGNIGLIKFNGSYSAAATGIRIAGGIGAIIFRNGAQEPANTYINSGGPTGIPVLTIPATIGNQLITNINVGVTTATMYRDALLTPLVSDPNNVKVHTPLTSDEANAIVANVEVITVESTHGPVANDMSYPNFIACSAELSWAYSTETHNLITPYIRPIKYGAGELFQTLDELVKYLNDPLFVIPPNTGDPGIATYFSDDFGVTPLRGLGTGHPAEMSEMYSPGLDRSFTESMISHSSRAEWIVPNDRMYYPEGTVVLGANVANGGGNISNWSVDVPVINYLEQPLWLVSRPGTLGEVTFQFDPYTTNQGEFQENADGSPLVTNPDIVDGDFLIGILKDSEVTKVLGNAQPFKVGYIRHFSSGFSYKGDPTLFTWFDPNYGETACMALLAAGTVIKYFNDNNVKHIIIDIRNTVGGLSTFFQAFTNLVGGDRKFNFDQVNRINGIDQNDVSVVRSLSNGQKYAEDAGALTYTLVNSLLDCNPSDLEAVQGPGQLDFPENSTFKAVSANVEDQKRIIWFTNATTISSTQGSYLIMKGSSLNQDSSDPNGFDGDLGNNVRFIGYGCYYRPFSTGGGYTSYINWYGVNRAGSEFIKKPLLYSIDRFEGSRNAYIDYVGRNDYIEPAPEVIPVLKGFDQDFTKFHQPQIKWNMEADIFFGDIGYVIDGNVAIDEGIPWVPLVDANVDFHNPLTWRDRTLEKSLVLATDLNVENHFYVDDGFGNI